MKNKQILAFLLMITLAACNNKKPANLTLKISGVKDTTISNTFVVYNYASKGLDTLTVYKNGVYNFTKQWSKPQILRLRTTNRRNDVTVFLSENPVVIEIDMSSKDITNNGVKTIYKKSELSDKYTEFRKGLVAIEKEAYKIGVEWQRLRKKYGTVPKDIRAPIDSASIACDTKKWEYVGNYAKNNNNVISRYLYVTKLRFSYNYSDLVQLVDKIPQKDKNGIYAKALSAKKDILKNLQTGAVAPEIVKEDVNGKKLALSSLRGKYVLLDFWASWCRPCRKENPWVKKAYEKYKNKGFDVYAVSFDYPGQKKRWLKAIKEDKLPWHHVSSLQGWHDPMSKIYNISGIPSPFLLDPEGKIIAKGDTLREQGLLDILDKILNNN